MKVRDGPAAVTGNEVCNRPLATPLGRRRFEDDPESQNTCLKACLNYAAPRGPWEPHTQSEDTQGIPDHCKNGPGFFYFLFPADFWSDFPVPGLPGLPGAKVLDLSKGSRKGSPDSGN